MFPKMGNFFPTVDANEGYTAAIAEALRRELGETHQAIKTIARWTGAHERTVKNWLSGVRGPSGEHVVELLRRSDAVLGVILQLSGRTDVAIAFEMVHARDRLAAITRLMDQLITLPPPRRSEPEPPPG
jgi:hypothetical protein